MLKHIGSFAGILVTTVFATVAQADWKDNTELDNNDSDHCITYNPNSVFLDGGGEISGYDRSEIESFLVETTYNARGRIPISKMDVMTSICLAQTPSGVHGEFHEPNKILINEDIFRFAYDKKLKHDYELVRHIANHETEHQFQFEMQTINISTLSSSQFIQYRFGEEMLAEYSNVDDNDMTDPEIYLNAWLNKNGSGIYPCLAHSYGLPNESGNSDALKEKDLWVMIGDHLPDIEELKVHFKEGSAIRTRMQGIADNYVLKNPDRTLADQCYLKRESDEYNLPSDYMRERQKFPIPTFSGQESN